MKKDEIIYNSDLYYEGILQLRPLNEELFNFTMKIIKKNKHYSLMKIVFLKNGYDLYFVSQRATQSVGSRLRKSFKGTIKKSKTLHTFDRLTSKKVYRVTVCFRLDE